MNTNLFELWVYLSASPLLWLSVTLGCYVLSEAVYQRAGSHPCANPVLTSVGTLAVLLATTDTSYQSYFEGAQFVHFLLGPATVSLAVPLSASLAQIRRLWRPILAALLVGSATSVFSVLLIAWSLGASPETLSSLAPKSVTAPVAMGIAQEIEGLPSLTAVLVVSTGILGAVVGPPLLSRLGIFDKAIRGFALGVASHGIGTAQALRESPEAGAFAGLGMGLNALATAVLLPTVYVLLTR